MGSGRRGAGRPRGRGGRSRPIKLLFLGDSGLHRPAERFAQLQPVMARRGIDIVYTDKASSLDPQVLAGYDGLIVYANTTQIAPEQEKALLDFVEAGKGLVALHCASFCFLNSPAYIDLVGAQFCATEPARFAPRSSPPTTRRCKALRASKAGTRHTFIRSTTRRGAPCWKLALKETRKNHGPG